MKAMGAEGKDILLIYLLQIMAVAAGGLVRTCARRRAALAVEHFLRRGFSRAAITRSILDPSPWRRPLGTLAAWALPFFRWRARGNRAARIVPRSGWRRLAPWGWRYRVAASARFAPSLRCRSCCRHICVQFGFSAEFAVAAALR